MFCNYWINFVYDSILHLADQRTIRMKPVKKNLINDVPKIKKKKNIYIYIYTHTHIYKLYNIHKIPTYGRSSSYDQLHSTSQHISDAKLTES